MRTHRSPTRGFSLLEVMVAVAILGMSLTVILSAQVGLFSSGTYAQHTTEAIGLTRCRMSELEEQFLKLGYPLVDTNDEGACCAGDTRQDMRCAWKIERVTLPNASPIGADGGTTSPFGNNPLGSNAGLNLATPNSLPTSTSTTGNDFNNNPPPRTDSFGAPLATVDAFGNPAPTATPGSLDAYGNPVPFGAPPGANPLDPFGAAGGALPPALSGGLGPLGALAAITGSSGSSLPTGASGLSGMLAGAATGGAGALAPMVMTIVYPSLKPMLEESIRKVTVTVLWREGMVKRDLEIIQWVSNPVKGGFLSGALGSDSASAGFPLGGLGGGPSPLGGGANPIGGGLGR